MDIPTSSSRYFTQTSVESFEQLITLPKSHKCDGIRKIELKSPHPLAGQRGCIASREIKKGECVAIYEGLHCINCPVHDYVMEIDFPRRLKWDTRYTDRKKSVKYYIDPLSETHPGNDCIFINDYRTDIVNERKNDENRQNVAFISVILGYEAYMAVIAMKNITKGSEILVDYGRPYWIETLKNLNKKKQ